MDIFVKSQDPKMRNSDFEMIVVVLATCLLAGQAKAAGLDENPHARPSVSSSIHEENVVELRALDDSIEATILTLADAEDVFGDNPFTPQVRTSPWWLQSLF